MPKMYFKLSANTIVIRYSQYRNYKSSKIDNKSKSNSTSGFSLSDIFTITDESGIPREMEDAALHIIKQKMVKSNLLNKSIEFKSGGLG